MNEQNLAGAVKRNVTLMITFSCLIAALMACGSPAARPNTQATIDAAVAATGTAQLAAQATIEAAVRATDTAQAAAQATVEAAVQATGAAEAAGQPSPEPTLAAIDTPPPTPIPVEEAATLSEEELAALIDQAVAEAIAATEQYSAAAEEVAADTTVTPEEIQTVEVYVSGAEEAIALAEELLELYADLYGIQAAETIAEIEEINQSLAELVEYTALMVATLEEMNSALEQGLELTEETIAELQAVAQAAGAGAGHTQEQLQAWAANRPPHAGGPGPGGAAVVEPNQIVADPQGAVQSVFEFVQTGQQAVADGELSPQDLATLAQLGANAGTSLNVQESAQLQQLAGHVETITAQLGAGNLPQLQEALGQLGVDTVGSMPPSQVAGDLPGAIQMVRSFAESGQQVTANGHISGAELAALAQLAANANASLNAHGGPQLQQLSGSIGDITGQIARGDVAQAQSGLKEFGASLGNIPEIEKPTLPEKPSRSNRN